MDALWNFEDKLKLSTEESAALLACTAFLFIGLCTAAATFLRKWSKRKRSLIHQEPIITACMELEAEDVMTMKRQRRSMAEQPSWGGVKKVLMSSVRWSGVNKWEERQREKPTPLLVSARFERNLGWQSHNSTSPVWQRPILMGEKCELPRFSGLILYDERGRPVHHHGDHGTVNYQQEEPTETAIGTTLRDLLQ